MRRLALLAGLVVLALIWLGPLLDLYRQSFTAHMLAHMGVVAIAAPLIGIGLTGMLWNSNHTSPTPAVSSTPIIASVLDLAVVWGWHAPAARLLVEQSDWAMLAEQASFLAAGLLLWLACLRPGHEGPGAFGLLLTSVHMTLLGALLALSPRPLYGSGEVTCLGITLSAGQDQQLGGVVMLLLGATVYLAGGLALLARLLGIRSQAGAG
jgi:putative membrane protein